MNLQSSLMPRPPDSEYQDVLPGNEELQQLNRAAVVVYAARSALRALMLVRFAGERNPVHLEAAFRAAQAAIAGCTARNAAEARRQAAAAAAAADTIAAGKHADVVAAEAAAARAAAALSTATAVPFDAAYATAAAAAWVADATANAIAATAYAARVAGTRAADTGAAVAAAAFAARAAVDVAARAASRAAARADYEMLSGPGPKVLGPLLFKQPLWPDDAPDWWEQARRRWHEAMEGVGLAPLGRQYEAWLRGEMDPDQMLREVEEWCGRYERQHKRGSPRPRARSGRSASPLEGRPEGRTGSGSRSPRGGNQSEA